MGRLAVFVVVCVLCVGCHGDSGPDAVLGPNSVTQAQGAVHATVHSEGIELDADGYGLVGPWGVQAVGDDDDVTVDHMPAGRFVISLTGVAPNCAVAGGDGKTIDIPGGGVANVDFRVKCLEHGTLNVHITLTGHRPVLAFIFVYKDQISGPLAMVGAALNSTTSIPVPPGWLTVDVGGLADYEGRRCTQDSVHVQVPEAGNVLVNLNLVCPSP